MTTVTHQMPESRTRADARTAGPVRRAADRARHSHVSGACVVLAGLLAGFIAAPYLLG